MEKNKLLRIVYFVEIRVKYLIEKAIFQFYAYFVKVK